jgi:hypothetical protein
VVSAQLAEQQVAPMAIGIHSVLQRLNAVLAQLPTAEILAWAITLEHSADHLLAIAIVTIFARRAHRFLTVETSTVK